MWQPIETAPKDGTWFLAYGERLDDDGKPHVGLCRWVVRKHQQWEYVSPRRQELIDLDESCWDYETGEIAYPTHWMPLPDPPE